MTQRIAKAVLPAAGAGLRFLPATKSQPKEMLPLVDTPIIQYSIEEARGAALNHVIIITGRGKSTIEDYFDVNVELEDVLKGRARQQDLELVRHISELITVSYIRQKYPRGVGQAVLLAEQLVGNEPFAVLLPDDVIVSDISCLTQLVAIFKEKASPVIAVMEVPEERIPHYGIVEISPQNSTDRLFQINDTIEKPSIHDAPSNLAMVGRYIFTPDIFKCLKLIEPDKTGEYQLTDGIKKLLEYQPVYAYRIEGSFYDIGEKLDFIKATIELALQREDIGPKFMQYLKGLKLG